MNGFRTEIQPSQQPVGEEEAPDPVVDFEESDIAPGQHRTDKQLPALQANGAAAGDLSPFIVTGIPRHREPRRHRMRARRKGRRRDRVAQGLVRPNRVELLAKAVEPALLRLEGGFRRTGCLRLERAMHAFVPPVILRASGSCGHPGRVR